jgi:hypothetical protein
MKRDEILLVNLSGRGDKDVISAWLPTRGREELMPKIQDASSGFAANGGAAW